MRAEPSREAQPTRSIPRSLKRGLAVVSVIGPCVALALMVAAHAGAAHADKATPPEVAPSFSLPDLAGQPHTLEEFRGRPVLLNFWATWCPACRAELGELEAVARSEHACVTLVGLVQSSGGPGPVQQFISERHLTYPMLLDDGSAGAAYGVETIPRSVLVGPGGELLRTFRGPVSQAGIAAALHDAGFQC